MGPMRMKVKFALLLLFLFAGFVLLINPEINNNIPSRILGISCLLIGCGVFLNWLVMRCNHHMMPVLIRRKRNTSLYLSVGISDRHILLDRSTKLKCLADIIKTRDGGMCSIGDICMDAGMICVYLGIFSAVVMMVLDLIT